MASRYAHRRSEDSNTGSGVLADTDAVRSWVTNARAGEALTYFRGHLAMAADVMPAAGHLATVVARLHSDGLVVPVQQRVGRHDYRYIVQRTARS